MTKIFIDPGHGGTDPGATANGLREKDLTLKIALKVRDILNKEYTGHQIKLSRTTDKTVSLRERTNMANNWKADYFLSIHINAGGGTGYEDFIYNGQTQAATARLRNVIHAEIVKETSVWRNRGKKQANFHVLRESHMSGMLTENGFIDNVTDANRLKNNAFLNKIARGHAVGLAKAFNLKRKPKPKKKATGKLYKVQIGAFSRKDNADRLASKARARGFDQFVVRQNNLYKVQIGAYSKKANADQQAAKAKKAGFDTYIVQE